MEVGQNQVNYRGADRGRGEVFSGGATAAASRPEALLSSIRINGFNMKFH